jgi:hypothetical protein
VGVPEQQVPVLPVKSVLKESSSLIGENQNVLYAIVRADDEAALIRNV